MHICALDGEKITNRQTLHDTLSSSLDLPEWYGRNLEDRKSTRLNSSHIH